MDWPCDTVGIKNMGEDWQRATQTYVTKVMFLSVVGKCLRIRTIYRPGKCR